MGGGHPWSVVTPDLDTLLIALYVEIDDHVIEAGRRRPGHPKRLTDAELVCLAVAQVLLGARSEHHWLRLCYGRLGHLFPYLPHQPGYHKRLKAAAPLLAAVMSHLARQCPSWYDQVRLIDATPVPCGSSRETVQRSDPGRATERSPRGRPRLGQRQQPERGTERAERQSTGAGGGDRPPRSLHNRIVARHRRIPIGDNPTALYFRDFCVCVSGF